MKMLKMCLHPKVIAALVAVAAGVWLVAPQWFAAALPILVLAICPLSMLLMMKMMVPGGAARQGAADDSSEASLQERLRHLEVQQAAVAEQLRAQRQPQA
jgi:hypothetical protein